MNSLHIRNPKDDLGFPRQSLGAFSCGIPEFEASIRYSSPFQIFGAVPPSGGVQLSARFEPCSAKGNAGPVSVKEKGREEGRENPWKSPIYRVASEGHRGIFPWKLTAKIWETSWVYQTTSKPSVSKLGQTCQEALDQYTAWLMHSNLLG